MNLLEINSQLQSIETKLDLLQWKIGAWSAWPLLRFNIAAISANIAMDTTDIRLTIRDHMVKAIRDVPGIIRTYRPQALLYVASSNRVEQEHNLYKDIIFDDLLQNIPKYFKIEQINNKYYLDRSRQALYPSQMTTSAIYLISNILSRYIKPYSVDKLANKFHLILQETLPVEKISRRHIMRVLTSFYWRKKLYRSLLVNLKPEVLLLQTAYMNHALVAAAKELNIKVIEFQHGIIDRHHPGYSWTKGARQYKAQMALPDRIFVYGDYWRDELAVNNFWDDELRPVGSLRIDQYRSRINTMDAVNRTDFLPERKIVVTTQALDVDRLISFLKESIKYYTKPLKMYIKLHPREANRLPYEAAFRDDANVKIISGHESPSTFELLSMADYHVSIHSTCHYEALGLGKPTVILPLTNHERILHLCEQAPGSALLAKTPAEFCQIITEDRTVPSSISSYYFRYGALNNMLNELQQYIGKQT